MSLKRAVTASCLAVLSLLAVVVTFAITIWNEALTAAGPSAGVRSLEWIAILAFLATFVVFALIARREFNVSIEYPQHREHNS